MSLYTIREIDFQHEDDRGYLVQLVHEGFNQINILESRIGAVRGAHYHKRAIEAFYVVTGRVEVALYNHKDKEVVEFKQGDFFEIHPFILHNMRFLEDCLMIQMYDYPVENKDGSKDIFTEEDFYA